MNLVLIASSLFSIAAFAGATDSSEIDGVWQMVSTDANGKITKETDEIVLRLTNGKLSETEESAKRHANDQADDADVEDIETEFRLKSETDPKQIDVILKKAAKGKKDLCIQGIYRRQGDELTLCFSIADANVIICSVFPEDSGPRPAEAPRPSNFDARDQITYKLKRVTTDKSQP